MEKDPGSVADGQRKGGDKELKMFVASRYCGTVMRLSWNVTVENMEMSIK